MSKVKLCGIASSFFFLFLSLLFASEDPFQWDLSPRKVRVPAGGSFSVELDLAIPADHYLYKEKTTLILLEGKGIRGGSVESTPSIRKVDPFFRREMEIFTDSAFVRRTFLADPDLSPGKREIRLGVNYQGCREELCYREMHHEVPIELEILSPSASGSSTSSFSSGEKGFFLQLGLAFLGGLLTDFTPCVLPIIPLTLGFIGVRREGRGVRNLLLTSVMVLSMSLTYALLGLTGALFGKSLGFLFQGIYFSIFASILFFILALALLGWIPFQIPTGLQNRIARMGACLPGGKGKGWIGSVLAGATIGLVAAPCVGPVIASLLLFVAQSAELMKGFSLLFFFGLGMGSLFLFLSLFFETLSGKIRGGVFPLWMKRIIALLLISISLYYGYVVFRQIRPQSWVSSVWLTEPETAFRKAYGEQKPVFVDFYATWCLPCLEMERKTFSNGQVREFLLQKMIPLKVDCTSETAVCKKMIDRYDVVGWPTYLILNSAGELQESIVGKVIAPDEFVKILSKYRSNIK